MTLDEVIVHKARVAHECAGVRCKREGRMISPGESYMKITTKPWTLIADDVDEDGRTVGSPAGEWSHMNFHLMCYAEEFYTIP